MYHNYDKLIKNYTEELQTSQCVLLVAGKSRFSHYLPCHCCYYYRLSHVLFRMSLTYPRVSGEGVGL